MQITRFDISEPEPDINIALRIINKQYIGFNPFYGRGKLKKTKYYKILNDRLDTTDMRRFIQTRNILCLANKCIIDDLQAAMLHDDDDDYYETATNAAEFVLNDEFI